METNCCLGILHMARTDIIEMSFLPNFWTVSWDHIFDDKKKRKQLLTARSIRKQLTLPVLHTLCLDHTDAVTVMILSFRTDMSGQTVQTQIRLLLEKQSDQCLHCLPFRLLCLDSLLLYGRATYDQLLLAQNGRCHLHWGIHVLQIL